MWAGMRKKKRGRRKGKRNEKKRFEIGRKNMNGNGMEREEEGKGKRIERGGKTNIK